MLDCLIVGGGAIGLSLACELADRGARVRVIDAGEPGRESSWAGAGILPPVGPQALAGPAPLVALSNRLHAAWHERLLAETGIDNGYRRSGGVYLAREPQSARQLHAAAAQWRNDGVELTELTDARALAAIEPGLEPGGALQAAVYLPGECQIRNPRHVRALLAACAVRGVEVSGNVKAEDFVVRGERIEAVCTPGGPITADRFCLATGAWTSALAERLGPPPPIRPVRGQIALFALDASPLARVVNEGLRYLVPRDDGRVLVGSTEEDAGFDRSTTTEAIAELERFGLSLCPRLATGRLERSWAGLRPASLDGWPYLGRIGQLENAFLAAGHFRSGLQLSTGTAVVMANLISGESPPIDLAPFRIDRHAGA